MTWPRTFKITIYTDNPHVFDALDPVAANYAAVMEQQHSRTGETVASWTKDGRVHTSALSDTENVVMQVVEEPRPVPGVYRSDQITQETDDPWAQQQRGVDWHRENPDE